MAQKGGTYRVPGTTTFASSPQKSNDSSKINDQESPGEKRKSSDKLAVENGLKARPETPSRTEDHEGGNDGQWVEVNHSEVDRESDFRGRSHVHIDFKLGWGKRKFTVFSFDARFGRLPHDDKH